MQKIYSSGMEKKEPLQKARSPKSQMNPFAFSQDFLIIGILKFIKEYDREPWFFQLEIDKFSYTIFKS